MINLVNNSENIIKIRVHQQLFNGNSGFYVFKLKSLSDNNNYVFTLTDVSEMKNTYSQFIITEDFMNQLKIGNYVLRICDLEKSSKILYTELVCVTSGIEDVKVEFIKNEDLSVFYDYEVEEVLAPEIPTGFNIILKSGISYVTWYSEVNTEYFEIWRAINDEDFILLNECPSLSYRDNYLVKNNMYSYKIRACNENEKSDFTKIKNIIN